MSLRIAFLDSWVQQIAEGSGTAAGIGGLQQALRDLGHQVSRIAPPSNRPAALTLRRLIYNVQLPALLRTLNYDLIIGFDIDGFAWSGRDTKTPYLCSIKGVIAEEMQHEGGQIRMLFEFLSRLEGHNARRANAVLTTSEYCSQAVQRHYGVASSQIKLVPEGIDLPRWRRMLNANAKNSDDATIVCVARQYPRKHVADLLQALPIVRQTIPNAHAIIVGDGPEHQPLRELARRLNLGDAVQFTGSLPNDEDVAAYYRRADIFCLPSVQEGFGIVFLEAMAAGLPIVATRSAAIPEVVLDRQAGLLVEPNNPQQLAQALTELLSDKQLRTQLGSFGQQHVESYDWPVVAQRFLAQVQPFLRH
jgi:glycosyltransferase involved in cell wall biosynthesis